MTSFDLNFFPLTDADDHELTDRIEWFLSALIRNGNIVGEHVIQQHEECRRVRVLCWSPDALDEANLTKWARQNLVRLDEFLRRPPQFQRISEVESEPQWCQCPNPTMRLLVTTFIDRLGSPVKCLACDCQKDELAAHFQSVATMPIGKRLTPNIINLTIHVTPCEGACRDMACHVRERVSHDRRVNASLYLKYGPPMANLN